MPEEKVILNGIRFDRDKTTKSTVRYRERDNQTLPNAVGTIYIRKWALGNPIPKTVEVFIKVTEE